MYYLFLNSYLEVVKIIKAPPNLCRIILVAKTKSGDAFGK